MFFRFIAQVPIKTEDSSAKLDKWRNGLEIASSRNMWSWNFVHKVPYFKYGIYEIKRRRLNMWTSTSKHFFENKIQGGFVWTLCCFCVEFSPKIFGSNRLFLQGIIKYKRCNQELNLWSSANIYRCLWSVSRSHHCSLLSVLGSGNKYGPKWRTFVVRSRWIC